MVAWPLMTEVRPYRRSAVLLGLGLVVGVLALGLRVWVTPVLARSPATPPVASFQTRGTITTLLDFEPGQAGQSPARDPIPVTHSMITTFDSAATKLAKAAGSDATVTNTVDQILTTDGRLIAQLNMRLAAQRDTQVLVDCCAVEVSGVRTPMAGFGSPLRFSWFTPLDARETFDPTLLSSVQLAYVGGERVGSFEALKFQQTTPATALGGVLVPGALVGSDLESVRLTRMRAVNRSLWVDPITGIILRASERVRETLRDNKGKDVLTLLAMNLASTPEQDSAQVALARAQGRPVRWSHTFGPIVGLFVGLGFFGCGGLGMLSAFRRSRVSWDFPDEAATFEDLRDSSG